MMSEDHSENGRVNGHGEEEVEPEIPSLGLKQSVDTPLDPASATPPDPGSAIPPDPASATHPGPASATPPDRASQEVEFFGQPGPGSEGDSPREQDNVSHHSRSYVTVSPSVSPDTSAQFGMEQDPDEVVKPKSLARTKLLQPCVLREAGMEEYEGQDMDLKVEVTDREMVGVKSDAYITYKICTQSSRPTSQFESDKYEVWRRYRDFEWLREVLEKNHFTLIVPPLPGKQLTRYFDQKSEEFLDERQKALNKFLQRLVAHPFFSFNKHLKTFLTAEPTEFTTYVAEMSSSNRLLGAMASSVKMAANSFRLKNPDPEYAKEMKYFEGLGEKLSAVERVAMRLHSERAELVSNMEELSTELMRWGMNEPQLVDVIRGMGACVENCTGSLKTLNDNNAYTMMVSAREYQLYCTSGVSAVRRRDSLQLDRERAAEEREKRKKVHDDVASAGKLQKLPKLAEDLQKAGVEAERTLDDLSVANEQLRVDLEKWKEAKDKELGKVMGTFADNHINHHTKCCDEWGKVLAVLRGPKPTPPAVNVNSEGAFASLGGASPLAGEGTAELYSPDLFT